MTAPSGVPCTVSSVAAVCSQSAETQALSERCVARLVAAGAVLWWARPDALTAGYSGRGASLSKVACAATKTPNG